MGKGGRIISINYCTSSDGAHTRVWLVLNFQLRSSSGGGGGAIVGHDSICAAAGR